MLVDPLSIPKALWLATVENTGKVKSDLTTDLSTFFGTHTNYIPQGTTPAVRVLVSFDGGATFYGYSDPTPSPISTEELLSIRKRVILADATSAAAPEEPSAAPVASAGESDATTQTADAVVPTEPCK